MYNCLLFFVIFLFFQRVNSADENFENVLDKDGYHFRYKTDDSERYEDGVIGEIEGDRALISVKGAYSFTTLDGKLYSVQYVADKNGYRPMLKFGTGVANVPPKKPTSIVPYIGTVTLDSLIGGGLG